MAAAQGFVGLDWGTTRVRAFLFDPAGRLVEQRTRPSGIARVAPDEFPAVLRALTAGWPPGPVLAAGMVGSRQGWREAPYLDCPADLTQLAEGLLVFVPDPQTGTAVGIVPGLATTDQDGAPDLLRGEETQVFGALSLGPDPGGSCLVVLPGTHSKWVRVADGRIRSFRTYLTGEIFGLLRDQSILRHLVASDEGDSEGQGEDPGAAAERPGAGDGGGGAADDWFLAGVRRARARRGVLHHVFGTRSYPLRGQLSPRQAGRYLSGLLIGEELASELAPDGTGGGVPAGSGQPAEEIVLVAEPALAALYAAACAALGRRSRVVAGATEAGLRQLFPRCAQRLRGAAPSS